MAKPKRGKYHEWITEEGLLRISGWAMDGLTDEQIAYNIGIAVRTLYRWKEQHSQICHALKKSKEVVDRQVENSLFKRALGYEYEEVRVVTKRDAGGEVTSIEETVNSRHMPADTTAIAIWLNNRKPDQYRRNAGKEKLDEKKFEEEKKNNEKKFW